jgi:hypothetical protein
MSKRASPALEGLVEDYITRLRDTTGIVVTALNPVKFEWASKMTVMAPRSLNSQSGMLLNDAEEAEDKVERLEKELRPAKGEYASKSKAAKQDRGRASGISHVRNIQQAMAREIDNFPSLNTGVVVPEDDEGKGLPRLPKPPSRGKERQNLSTPSTISWRLKAGCLRTLIDGRRRRLTRTLLCRLNMNRTSGPIIKRWQPII